MVATDEPLLHCAYACVCVCVCVCVHVCVKLLGEHAKHTHDPDELLYIDSDMRLVNYKTT